MLVPETRSIFELIQSKEPIWVINNTKNPSYLVALDFGRGVKFPPLPPGPDPICLTDMIPHKYIEESYDFHQAVAKGLLLIVTDQSAKEYFEKNKGRKEAIKAKLEQLIGSPGLVTETQAGAVTSRQSDARDLLSPKVLQLHLAFKERNIDEKTLLSELLEIQNDLTENELDYLRALNNPAVTQFVVELTAERNKDSKKKKEGRKEKDEFPLD